MVGTTSDWEDELGRWLEPFLERLGHRSRQRMCPLYVAGLIGPGDRKSVQPMAERLAPGDYDQLHHFVAAGVWKEAPLETELLIQADKLVGGSDAVLVIDDTSMPKKGKHSVGVAAQYASALGKTANCQTLVSLTLARGEVPVTVALRLFLPESWTSDRARLKRVGVPAEHRTARTKPEIALAEIDHMIAARVHFGCVLADAGYGLSAPFRQGLTARGLAWAVGIPRHLKVYPVGVRLISLMGFAGFTRTPTSARPGTFSLSSSSRLTASSGVKNVNPVTFPPGRAMLDTRPVATASPLTAITMGIVAVACLAARIPGMPWVTITSTFKRTNSAANAGSWSSLPSAHRYSMTMSRPS